MSRGEETCSCHPKGLIAKIRAAVHAETASVMLALVLGFLMGGCAQYAFGHVTIERRDPRTSARAEEAASIGACGPDAEPVTVGTLVQVGCRDKTQPWEILRK